MICKTRLGQSRLDASCPSATDPTLIILPRDNEPLPVFHPEFGRFMLEATPGKPWGIDLKELLSVEPNMKLR